MSLQPPYLSVFDPPETSEGGIDPLSLQGTYENLAERVYPFITARMARPRYLTAMVVGAHICGEFIDELASDGTTPAWLVFEWHVVEALVRCMPGFPAAQMAQVPGSQKVGRAVNESRRIGADAYLKTPKVFGYTGVYKRLARGLRMLSEDMELDEAGFALLSVWEKEQGLKGFRADTKGKGAEFRDQLKRAVKETMRRGYVTRQALPFWQTIAQHLRPGGARKKEVDCIAQQLFSAELHLTTHDPLAEHVRREMMEHIVDGGESISRFEEHIFFRRVIRKASAELRVRLQCIDAYEGVGRLANDALRLILHLSSDRRATPVTEQSFSQHALARKLTERLPAAVGHLQESAPTMDGLQAVSRLIERYGDVRTPSEFYNEVLAHHEEAQRNKPPDGKRPWFDRIGDGVVVRTLYRHSDPPAGDDSYVFDYRTSSVCSFLRDLKRLPT